MENEELKNQFVAIKVNKKGAELVSITNNVGHEYLWNANPDFWNRHSPILFPIVGSLSHGNYNIKGEKYKMSQHGFARDMDFELIEKSENRLVYSLVNNEQTEKIYPYHFILNIGYELINNSIKVFWIVKNNSKKAIYFQIGAHPGFFYPNFELKETLRGYLKIDTQEFDYTLPEENGLINKSKLLTMNSTNNLYPILSNTFDNQALIIENSQISKIELLDQHKKPYLTLRFDTPVIGLWSPPHKNAPFICIEPWYGRADQIDYNGDFRDKEWMNKLEEGKRFDAFYYIDIEQ